MNFRAKVVDLKERNESNNGKDRTFFDVVLADETGSVNAIFFGTDDVKKNQVYTFRGVFAKVVREHIQIQRGRNGRINRVWIKFIR